MNIARMRNTKAFTLIELIVVIVIMGILVAIGAFAYNAVIKSAKKSAVEKVAAQVAKTVQADSAANQASLRLSVKATPAPWNDDVNSAKTTVTPSTSGDSFAVIQDGYCVAVTVPDQVGTALTVGSAVVKPATIVTAGTCA